MAGERDTVDLDGIRRLLAHVPMWDEVASFNLNRRSFQATVRGDFVVTPEACEMTALFVASARHIVADLLAEVDRLRAAPAPPQAEPAPQGREGVRSAADLSCPECGGASCHSPLPAVDTVCPECGGGRNWHRQHACLGRSGRGER